MFRQQLKYLTEIENALIEREMSGQSVSLLQSTWHDRLRMTCCGFLVEGEAINRKAESHRVEEEKTLECSKAIAKKSFDCPST